MEEKIQQLNAYFSEQIGQCEQRQRALQADQREDEAVFQKIRANVYDIFCTMLTVAIKNSRGDAAETAHFFRQKWEQLSAAWSAARDRAEQHNDPVQLRLEEVKLDTAAEIVRHFDEVWG